MLGKSDLLAMMKNVIRYDDPGWEESYNKLRERYLDRIVEKRYQNLDRYRSGEIYVETAKGKKEDFADLLEFWIAAIVTIYDEDSWNFRLDYIENGLCRGVGGEKILGHIDYCNNYITTPIEVDDNYKIKDALQMYDHWNNLEFIWEDEEEFTLLNWSTSA